MLSFDDFFFFLSEFKITLKKLFNVMLMKLRSRVDCIKEGGDVIMSHHDNFNFDFMQFYLN